MHYLGQQDMRHHQDILRMGAEVSMVWKPTNHGLLPKLTPTNIPTESETRRAPNKTNVDYIKR